MLSLLHIENIAVIESADISFEEGFNALTGETGAGKSIVIDAIGAVLGERTSRDMIRTGASSALVSAVFCRLPELSWFRENGMGPDEDGNLLLQREIQQDGKNVCRMNGRPLTVTQLRGLGQQLLNIHGQHDGQQLMDERLHLDYLDRFGGTEALLAPFRETFGTLQEIRQQIASLQMDEAEKSRRIDTLTYQIRELERAELKQGEEEELSSRRELLRNAGKVTDAVEEAYAALAGTEETEGAAALFAAAASSLRRASGVAGELEELAGKAEELRYAADDLAEALRDWRERMDFSPEELDRLESRLDVLYRLKKKYGSTEAEMLDYLDRCRAELDSMESADDRLMQLEKQQKTVLEQAKKQAETLSKARKQAAKGMEERIQSELTQLDMPKVRFCVEFSAKESEWGMDATGMDEVRFLMSANVGEALKPISKIASGGELARIMLALKNVLAENDDVSTLVFDEVDTGVSGRAAQKVAEKMADVARHKQVLCVTHLPQIAAMADAHFSVQKGERNGRTFTDVARLDEEGRKKELARLTSGDAVTKVSLESAGEMLTYAARYKASKKG